MPKRSRRGWMIERVKQAEGCIDKARWHIQQLVDTAEGRSEVVNASAESLEYMGKVWAEAMEKTRLSL